MVEWFNSAFSFFIFTLVLNKSFFSYLNQLLLFCWSFCVFISVLLVAVEISRLMIAGVLYF